MLQLRCTSAHAVIGEHNAVRLSMSRGYEASVDDSEEERLPSHILIVTWSEVVDVGTWLQPASTGQLPRLVACGRWSQHIASVILMAMQKKEIFFAGYLIRMHTSICICRSIGSYAVENNNCIHCCWADCVKACSTSHRVDSIRMTKPGKSTSRKTTKRDNRHLHVKQQIRLRGCFQEWL